MGLVNFDIGNLFKDIREAVTGKTIEDPIKKAEIKLKLKELEQAINLGQIEINKTEAQNPNWFISGWRPFIGWSCGFAIVYSFIIAPFLHSMFAIFKVNFPIPELNIGILFNLLLSMLGLAGLRTYEKSKGVNSNHG